MEASDNTSLVPALLQALHKEPDQPALYWHGRCISRGALWHKTRQVARQLEAASIGHGQVVAVLLPRCPELLVVLLALWQRGAVYLPLDDSWPQARKEAAMDLAAASVLITTETLQASLARSNCPVLLLAAAREWPSCTSTAGSPPDSAQIEPGRDDPAYLLFTSGSSGQPKAVEVSHGALLTLFTAILPQLQLQPGWRVLACNGQCFDIVFFEWLAPLLSGGSIVLTEAAVQADTSALLQLIEQHRIAVLQATPSLWRLLRNNSGLPATSAALRHLQCIISTGEALDRDTAQFLLALGGTVWNLYGPTECTIWSSAKRVEADELQRGGDFVSIGAPLAGYAFSLLPHAELPQADCGELLIAGPGVATRYLGAAPQQQQRFGQTPAGQRSFRSGDLCRRDADGHYHFLRRSDSQLKINGYRIEAGEIEARLRTHPGIRDAACLARTLAGGSQLIACVVCVPGTPNKNRERWNRYLAEWLPEWMLPQRYLVLETLPLDRNGKVDRKALLQLAGSGAPAAAASPGEGLQDDIQRAVRNTFCSILETDDIGLCDSFFDHGGNSMLAATLLLALNQHFGTGLRLREVLQSPPTIQRLTRLLRAALASDTAALAPE